MNTHNNNGTQSPQSAQRIMNSWRSVKSGIFAAFAAFAFLSVVAGAQTKPRARELGIAPGVYPTGAGSEAIPIDRLRPLLKR